MGLETATVRYLRIAVKRYTCFYNESPQNHRQLVNSKMNRRKFLTSFLGSGLACLAIAGTTAGNVAQAATISLSDSKFMKTGFSIPTHRSYKTFLPKYNQFKTGGHEIEPITFTPDLKRYVYKINKQFNASVKYQEEKGFDSWDVVVGSGDCEDIAITKFDKFLTDKVLNRQNFSIATCVAENKIGHAVLVLHAKDADYIIDNRYDHIPIWNRLPYYWLTLENHKNNNRFLSVLNFRKPFKKWSTPSLIS